jgi:hypothetical protein
MRHVKWLGPTLIGGLAAAVLLIRPVAVPAASADADEQRAYRETVRKTAAMVSDAEAVKLAQKHGLQVLNLTWEDTGRFKNSAVGPNISDMTIQVQTHDPATGQYHATCMPVIRFPNFEDKTGDVKTDKFSLLVGNEKGKPPLRVSLKEYLGNPRKYLSKPRSWKGDSTFLHADRDTHVLVSAQACFLPVPKKGKAEFNPVLFNYQSMPGDPAVLAILATREGTSATIIDNQRDGFQTRGVWGQRLFFNHNGERTSLTGERLSDFVASGTGDSTNTDPSKTPTASNQGGLNMVMLIQVPLKQKQKPRLDGGQEVELDLSPLSDPGDPKASRRSDVEEAVIGHGKVEGPFTEIDGLPIERDPNFPVRVTVQFYKATSNGVVSEADMAEVAKQIQKVYDQADYVGSLVTEGLTQRPTEYDGDKVEPPEWWADFWERYHKERGRTREEVIVALREVKGADWFPMTEGELAREAEALSAGISSPQRWSLWGWIGVAALAVVAISAGVVFSARRGRAPAK